MAVRERVGYLPAHAPRVSLCQRTVPHQQLVARGAAELDDQVDRARRLDDLDERRNPGMPGIVIGEPPQHADLVGHRLSQHRVVQPKAINRLHRKQLLVIMRLGDERHESKRATAQHFMYFVRVPLIGGVPRRGQPRAHLCSRWWRPRRPRAHQIERRTHHRERAQRPSLW